MWLSIVVKISNNKIWLWNIYPAYSDLWEQFQIFLSHVFIAWKPEPWQCPILLVKNSNPDTAHPNIAPPSLSSHERPWTKIPYYIKFLFITDLDILPQISVDKWWHCIRVSLYTNFSYPVLKKYCTVDIIPSERKLTLIGILQWYATYIVTPFFNSCLITILCIV
jgi:hypothetical protein